MASHFEGLRGSPPAMSSAASTSTATPGRPAIVSKLAIEGKAKHDSEGARVKYYIKLTMTYDAALEGRTIPLFPEENIKIRASQVHPLDPSGTPYNFSSTTCPLIHNAARALGLSTRSHRSYVSLFGDSPTPRSSDMHYSSGPSHLPALEERYTGSIQVSGYHICFVPPKDLPPRHRVLGASAINEEDRSSRKADTSRSSIRRRGSFMDKPSLQFIAAIDTWVSLLDKPSGSPYLLSVPTPRCLLNTIKLEIPPIVSVAASLQSLSSEEDVTGWDVTSDPHVTRPPSHPRRSTSPRSSSQYNHFADDESSDSASQGSGAGGSTLQGTFPSSDYMRIRWASTTVASQYMDYEDGRQRLKVKDVQGHLTCTVLGAETTTSGSMGAVKARLDYQGICKGLHFPGVATALGMDVALKIPGYDVAWPDGGDPRWQVDGEAGFTGFAVGPPAKSLAERPSLEISQMTSRDPSPVPSRSSSGSSSSLLRAPLPQANTPEYSFETSSTPTISASSSSMGSLTPGSSFTTESGITPPATPITLHLNMNDLIPPSRAAFIFNITGTVLLSPAPSASSYSAGLNRVSTRIPVFRVLTAENQALNITVRNHSEVDIIEVMEAPGQSPRKIVLSSGNEAKCHSEDAHIVVKRASTSTPPTPSAGGYSVTSNTSHISRPSPEREDKDENSSITTNTPRTSVSGSRRRSASVASERDASRSRAHTTAAARQHVFRDGPLIIPWVSADIVPFRPSSKSSSYAVTLRLPVPIEGPSEWLEFGLALPAASDTGPSKSAPPKFDVSPIDLRNPPEVEIACASIDGVPVRYETFGRLRPQEESELGQVVEKPPSQRWLTWIRVYAASGRQMEVVYIVNQKGTDSENRKARRRRPQGFSVHLPVFSLPVARFAVTVDHPSDHRVLLHVPDETLERSSTDAPRLHAFNLLAFAQPQLSLSLVPTIPPSTLFSSLMRVFAWFGVHVLPLVIGSLILSHTIGLRIKMHEMDKTLNSLLNVSDASIAGGGWADGTHTTTLTTTIYRTPSASSQRWWPVGEEASSSSSSTSVLNPSPSIPPSPVASPAPSSSQSQQLVPPPTQPRQVTLTPQPTPTESDYVAAGSANSHMLIPFVPLSWFADIQLDYLKLKSHTYDAFTVIWQAFRRMYHWPLPPD